MDKKRDYINAPSPVKKRRWHSCEGIRIDYGADSPLINCPGTAVKEERYCAACRPYAAGMRRLRAQLQRIAGSGRSALDESTTGKKAPRNTAALREEVEEVQEETPQEVPQEETPAPAAKPDPKIRAPRTVLPPAVPPPRPEPKKSLWPTFDEVWLPESEEKP